MERSPDARGALAPISLPAGTMLDALVGGWRLHVPAERVVEIVARAAHVPLPGAPAGVRGVLDHRGTAAVVVDLRERFGLAAPIRRWDPFVVVDGTPRWALIVDEVRGIAVGDRSERVAEGLPQARAGIVLDADGTALLLDPRALLDEAETEQLRSALAEHARSLG